MVYQDMKKGSNPSVFRYILVIFLLYIYFNSVHFRFLGDFVSQHILILAVLVCYDDKMFSFIRQNKKILWFYVLLLIVTAFITLNGGDKKPLNNSVLRIVYYMYVPSIMIPYMIHHRLSFSKCLIAIGWISGLVSTFCFISPYFASLMSDWFSNSVEDLDRLTIGRTFGIASGITYAYGLVNAFIFAYALSINYFKKWYSVLFLILLLFATVINTRTSFVIELIYGLLYFITISPPKRIKYLAIVVCVVTFVTYYILPAILATETGFWLTQGYYMFYDYIYGTNMGNSNIFVTLQGMIVFPKTLEEWMFGTGRFIYLRSDIGFILQLYYGGLFYLLLLLIYYYITIKLIDNKYLFVCSIIMLLIANYKGVFLEYNDGFKLITFIALYFAYSSKSADNDKVLKVK